MLAKNPIQDFIPWRAVWNSNSISTPCCLVFDATQPTVSGTSLNDILEKGKNNMNKLVEIVICWSTHKIGFHTDVKKMYNTVQLREEHWCIYGKMCLTTERYLKRMIKTLIYGVKSSGNQSQWGLHICLQWNSLKSITLYRRIYMLMIVCLMHRI